MKVYLFVLLFAAALAQHYRRTNGVMVNDRSDRIVAAIKRARVERIFKMLMLKCAAGHKETCQNAESVLLFIKARF